MTKPVAQPILWSQAQSTQAAEIWQLQFADYHGDDDPFARELATLRNRVLHAIAAAIGRSFDSVEYRLQTNGASFGANQRSSRHASPREEADRAARKEAANRQDLTAQFFGDPPPGYSALDRKRQGMGT